MTVAPVATGAVDIDAADVVSGDSKNCRELLAQVVRCLGSRPTRELATVEFRDGAGRTDRTMGMDCEVIGRGQFARRAGQGIGRGPAAAGDMVAPALRGGHLP